MASPNVLPPPAANSRSTSDQYVHMTEKMPQLPVRERGARRHEQAMNEPLTDVRQRKEEFDNPIRKIDPSSYRQSLFHNTCTAILAEGYHKSFTELFELVQRQREEHRKSGPASVLLSPLIHGKEDKLDYLQVCLTGAEEASRRGDVDAVYMAQRDLALHFEQTGDHWLADHFHSRCLETGQLIKGDNSRKEGEAHFHVGLAYENRGDLQKGVEHMETFYELTSSNSWHTESGESLYRISCEHLRRLYTSIAEKSEDTATAISYLQKAHSMSKKAKDIYQEGLASHRLGCAHERNNDYNTAIQCHKSFLERSRYHGDEVGMGNAYEALARCHEHKGDLENAVKCLELYVGVAEKSGVTESLAKSCNAAGTMFNTLGDYKKTVEYFFKCYSYCQQLNDKSALEAARVQYGIAQAHYQMEQFIAAIGDQTDRGMNKLVNWKGRRALEESEKRESIVIPQEIIEVEEEKNEEDENDQNDSKEENQTEENA